MRDPTDDEVDAAKEAQDNGAEIDCDGTDEAVCPYCGYVEDCSHEFFDSNHDSTVATCSDCGKDYDLTRDISVSYSSSKKETPHA